MRGVFSGATRGKDRGVALASVKGAIAGAIGTWVMDQVTWGMYLREDPEAFRQEQKARIENKDVADVAAGKLARAVGAKSAPEQSQMVGLAIHYALGVAPGALYGPLRSRWQKLGAARGFLYGLVLFVVNDEVMGPVLGLASGPTAYPWQAHARGLVGHLTLGVVTDAVIDLIDQVT